MEFATFLERIENKYQFYIDKLELACKHNKTVIKTIGKVGKYELYQTILNPKGAKTICFIGAVHGNEIVGPHAILKFLEEGKFGKNRIILYPIANPIGFQNFTRSATGRLNINRQFQKDELEHESKLLKDALDKEKIDLLVTFHEDDSPNAGIYVYYGKPEQKELAKKIVEVGTKYVPIDPRKNIFGDKARSGLILVDPNDEKPQNKKSLENYKKNLNYFCIELPTRFPLETREQCGKAIIKLLLK